MSLGLEICCIKGLCTTFDEGCIGRGGGVFAPRINGTSDRRSRDELMRRVML